MLPQNPLVARRGSNPDMECNGDPDPWMILEEKEQQIKSQG